MLLDRGITAQDVPQVLEFLSPEVRYLGLECNFFCFAQSKGNRLGDEGATPLADMLKTNSTLTEINLGEDNQIGDKGATALADMLKTNSTLKIIRLYGE